MSSSDVGHTALARTARAADFSVELTKQGTRSPLLCLGFSVLTLPVFAADVVYGLVGLAVVVHKAVVLPRGVALRHREQLAIFVGQA